MPTWTVTANNGISAQVDNTHVWSAGGALKSIKLTETSNPGANYYVILSNRFPVQAGQQLIADAVGYGGTSTGNFQVTIGYYFSSTDPNQPVIYETPVGGELSTEYADHADPAYTGNRLWWAKIDALPIYAVPPGYDFAQEEITISELNAGDSVWLGFAGVNPLN
jgi:hypothetical protein